jgi:hypothetical protein
MKLRKSQLRQLIREELKRSLKENNSIPEDIEDYLTELVNWDIPEDADEGEEVMGEFKKKEYGDPEAYEDAHLFDKSYKYIKANGGKITMEGNPDINFMVGPGGNIKYSLIQSLS